MNKLHGPDVRMDQREKVLLFTEDGRRAVGIGPNLLSIHMLRPYQDPESPEGSGWNEFALRIEAALDAYCKAANPSDVSHVSMRYVNRLPTQEPVFAIREHLRGALPDVDLPGEIGKHVSRTEYVRGDGIRVYLTYGTASPGSGDRDFLLDIDVAWGASGEETITPAQALERVEQLREIEREAFESVITEAAREVFDAE